MRDLYIYIFLEIMSGQENLLAARIFKISLCATEVEAERQKGSDRELLLYFCIYRRFFGFVAPVFPEQKTWANPRERH